MADKENMNLGEGLSNFADDEALKEIDFTSFLEENAGEAPLFEGFHEDIESTEKSIASELQSLYDDIINSGPATIVPKPLSVLTSSEEPKEEPVIKDSSEATSLDELWLSPEDYIDSDIPVVSLDGDDDVYEPSDIPEDIFFKPEASVEETGSPEHEPIAAPEGFDSIKNDIFSMIDSLKTDSMGDSGFGDILSEIESNAEIEPVADDYSAIASLIDNLPPEREQELPFEETPEAALPEENEEDFELEEALTEDEIPETVTTIEDIEDGEAEENFNSDSEDFQRELAELLGDEQPSPDAQPEENTEEKPSAGAFVITIPDDDNDYEAAARATQEQQQVDDYLQGYSNITAGEPVVAPPANEPFNPAQGLEDNDDDDKEYKAELKAEKKAAKARAKAKREENKNAPSEIIRKIVLSLSLIVIVASSAYLAYTYLYQPNQAEKLQSSVSEQLSNSLDTYGEAVVDSAMRNSFGVDFPDGMLAKYAQLYAVNSDLKGWIKIPELGIDLPVVQGDDNDYYLKKDVYKKYTNYGVPFFDYRTNGFEELHKNTVIYGHNMRSDDLIFGMLENYKEIDGFKSAPTIECNTIYGNYTWFVYAVFITNAYESDDNGYVLPYNFIDISDSQFEDYIAEIDKRKLYTTGVDINSSDKILTLSTCSYEFDDARLVVVARLKRTGESINVDTSKAVENPNPKYPQAWYDAYKKSNPYAEDSNW